jgi:hypothetical protein
MFRTAIITLAAALLAAPALATDYDEAVSGDLSSDATTPTAIGSLTAHDNHISGATIPSGPFNPVTHSLAVVDNDYLNFVIPVGRKLSAITIAYGSVIEPTDRMFFGIASGYGVSVDPSFSSAAGLLGWTLIGKSMIGTNVLPALGQSAPANFPAVPGATGFTGSLGAGSYTLWLLDGDSPARYKLDLVTSQVPEPAAWAMMVTGFGLIGGLARRRPVLRRQPALA